LFTSHRWERSLSDLQAPAQGDSLIPMFESMVDRALSRTQVDYAPKKAAAAAVADPAMPSAESLYSAASQIRRVQ
jgi:hypothetical protein